MQKRCLRWWRDGLCDGSGLNDLLKENIRRNYMPGSHRWLTHIFPPIPGHRTEEKHILPTEIM
ncbi:unnamed protein product, partial [Gadus morhua 'NCC']